MLITPHVSTRLPQDRIERGVLAEVVKYIKYIIILSDTSCHTIPNINDGSAIFILK